jgi:hypothetical protein
MTACASSHRHLGYASISLKKYRVNNTQGAGRPAPRDIRDIYS